MFHPFTNPSVNGMIIYSNFLGSVCAVQKQQNQQTRPPLRAVEPSAFATFGSGTEYSVEDRHSSVSQHCRNQSSLKQESVRLPLVTFAERFVVTSQSVNIVSSEANAFHFSVQISSKLREIRVFPLNLEGNCGKSRLGRKVCFPH